VVFRFCFFFFFLNKKCFINQIIQITVRNVDTILYNCLKFKSTMLSWAMRIQELKSMGRFFQMNNASLYKIISGIQQVYHYDMKNCNQSALSALRTACYTNWQYEILIQPYINNFKHLVSKLYLNSF